MREQRTKVEVPLTGRRNRKSAPNSLQFFATIEGVETDDAHIRSSNGMRWRIA